MSEQNTPYKVQANHGAIPGPLHYVGLVAAFVPFVFSLRSSNSSSVTTTITDAAGNEITTGTATTQFFDPVALVGGGVAVLVAIALLAQLGKVPAAKRPLHLGIAAAAVVVGSYQLALRSGILSG